MTQIGYYLSYNDFFNLMTASKKIYHKKILHKIQAKLIINGISERRHKKFWIQKCKIKYNMPLYKKYFTGSTNSEREINKDIMRTFNESHIFCSNPDNFGKLKRILHAFAVKHPEIGYIQGLNFIVGNLIIQFPEEVFFPQY